MLDNYYARDEEDLWIQLQRFSRRLAASCVCVLQDTSCQKGIYPVRHALALQLTQCMDLYLKVKLVSD